MPKPENKKEEYPNIPGVKAWLTDTNITEVSLVKSPYIPCSPQANIQMIKAMNFEKQPELVLVAKSTKSPSTDSGRVNFQKRFRIMKVDKEAKKIYGYVYAPNTPDLEGDAMTPAELEKAAHSLLKNLTGKTVKGDGAGLNHVEFEDIFKFTESAIDHDGSLGKSHGFSEVIPGAWFIGVEVVSVEIWKSVDNKEITGFSWGGTADRNPVEEEAQKSNIIKKLLSKFNINKTDPADFAEFQSVIDISSRVDDMFWNLRDILDWILWSDIELDRKISFIKESVLQFYTAVADLLNNLPTYDLSPEIAELINKVSQAQTSIGTAHTEINGILESFEKITKGEEEMTEEQILKAVKDGVSEELGNVTKRLDDIEKDNKEFKDKFAALEKDDPPEEGDDKTKTTDPTPEEKILSALDELTTEVKALDTRVEKVEKTPTGARSEEDESELAEKVSKDKKGIIRGADGKIDYSKTAQAQNWRLPTPGQSR